MCELLSSLDVTSAAFGSLSTVCSLSFVSDPANVPDDGQEFGRLSGVHQYMARVQLSQRYTVKKQTLIFIVPQSNNLVDNVTQNYTLFYIHTWCKSVLVILNSGLSSATDDRTESEAVSAL